MVKMQNKYVIKSIQNKVIYYYKLMIEIKKSLSSKKGINNFIITKRETDLAWINLVKFMSNSSFFDYEIDKNNKPFSNYEDMNALPSMFKKTLDNVFVNSRGEIEFSNKNNMDKKPELNQNFEEKGYLNDIKVFDEICSILKILLIIKTALKSYEILTMKKPYLPKIVDNSYKDVDLLSENLSIEFNRLKKELEKEYIKYFVFNRNQRVRLTDKDFEYVWKTANDFGIEINDSISQENIYFLQGLFFESNCKKKKFKVFDNSSEKIEKKEVYHEVFGFKLTEDELNDFLYKFLPSKGVNLLTINPEKCVKYIKEFKGKNGNPYAEIKKRSNNNKLEIAM